MEPGWGFFATEQPRQCFLEFCRTQTMSFSERQMRSEDFCGIVGRFVVLPRNVASVCGGLHNVAEERNCSQEDVTAILGFWMLVLVGFYRYEGIGIMSESDVQKNVLSF